MRYIKNTFITPLGQLNLYSKLILYAQNLWYYKRQKTWTRNEGLKEKRGKNKEIYKFIKESYKN